MQIESNNNPRKNNLQRLRRARWIVFLAATLLVFLVEVVNYFFLGLPLFEDVVNLAFGVLIAWIMTTFGFHYFARLQNDLHEAIIKLETAEVQLRVQSAALEAAANAIVITDNDGRITWTNRAFTELTGYTSEEVIGQNPRLLRSGAHRPSFYQVLWETIQDGRVWYGEVINKRKDGTLYTEEQTITPVLDENGHINCFIAIKQDITRRKQTQADERERREWMEALREAGIVLSDSLDFDILLDHLLDQVGRIVPYDSASLMIREGDQAQVIRHHGYDQFDDKLDQIFVNHVFDLNNTANLRLVVQSQQPLIIPDVAEFPEWVYLKTEYSIRSWVGVPIVLEDEVVAIFSLDKQEPGFFQLSHTWLLEAFAAQAALAWRNARLFEETRRHARELDLLNRIIVATIPVENEAQLLQIGCEELARFFAIDQVVSVLLDQTQTYVAVNAEWLAPDLSSLLGFQVSIADNPLLQKFFSTTEPLVMSDTRQLPLPPQMAAILTQRGIISALTVPILFREKVIGAIGIHSRQLHEFTTTEIRLAQTVGEELGQSLELVQLNDRLRAHAAKLEDRVAERTQELATANERLQELDRLKSKFVSDVSHELRTPITNLGMYLDLLERGRQDKREHYIGVLRQESKRLSQLVEGILDLSRLETDPNRDSVQFAPVALKQLVEQVVVAQIPQAEAAGLTLTFVPAPEIPPIMGVHNQIVQVVTNLLANAINYTHEGQIQVTLFQEDGQVCLQVTDSGMGIGSEDLPHLFERFYRGQHVGQFSIPGAGLGLAIIKDIVEMHKGRIVVESDLGHGSTFQVWLPTIVTS